MAIRGVALTITYTAWDTINNIPKISDVANHTIKVIKDGTEATATNNGSITEVGASTSPGEYKITITSTEMTADFVTVAGKSTTSGIVIIPVKITTEHGVLPSIQQGNAGAVLTSGTGTAQLKVTSGIIDLPAITSNWLTPTGIQASALNGKGDWLLSTSAPSNFESLAITAGGIVQADIQTIKTQTVTCSAAVTVNPNIGTTQPINFTGTSSSALIKTDITDWATHSVSVDTNNNPIMTLAATGFSATKESSGTYDIRQVITMIWEMLMAGKISGLPTSPAVIRDFADAVDRAHIAFDSNNNRTSFTVNNAP